MLLYQSVSFSSCGHRTRLPQAADLNENFAAQILGCKVKNLTFGSYSRDILWPTKVETLAQVSYQPSGWPIKRIGSAQIIYIGRSELAMSSAPTSIGNKIFS